MSTEHRVRKQLDRLLSGAESALLPDALRADFGSHLDADADRARLDDLAREHPTPGLDQRLAALDRARAAAAERPAYLQRYGCTGVQRFTAAADTRLYVLRVETFPGHINNVALIVEPGHLVLYDVGSGFDSSTRDLALGMAIARDAFAEDVSFERVDTAVISHAHIDHFGGVPYLRQRSSARVCVHELDARVLDNFEERVVVATKDVDVFLRRAGVDDDTRRGMLSLYGASRHWFTSQEVDWALRDGDHIGNGHLVIHAPGHCPGLICVRVGRVLLTSDHVLARITPHQFPQAITPFAGLEHYLESLEKVRRQSGVELAIGGHEEPITDFRGRVDQIAGFHRARLREVHEMCARPTTVYQVATQLFGEQSGYGRILAVEEAGAHVEYLHARGQLRLANLAEVAAAAAPVLEYVAR